MKVTLSPAEVKVKVRFVASQDGVTFSDALNYDLAEYEKLSPEDIEQSAIARFSDWVMRQAAEPKEITKELLIAEKVSLQDQKDQLEVRLLDIQNKIDGTRDG